MSNPSHIDFQALGAELDFSLDEFIRLVVVFVRSAGQDIEKIEAAHALGDSGAVVRAAHSLKGSSGNLGFRNMYELARSLETTAKATPPAVGESTIHAIRKEYSEIVAKVNTYNRPS